MRFLLLIFQLHFCTASSIAQEFYDVDFNKPIGKGIPYVFGATQARGLSDPQWDLLVKHGFYHSSVSG